MSTRVPEGFEPGGVYDLSFKNALAKVAPEQMAREVGPTHSHGPWFHEVLWSDGEPYDPKVGVLWVRSYAHHQTRQKWNLGHATLEEAHAWVAANNPEHLSCEDGPINEIFRVRFVYSPGGLPAEETRSTTQVYDLGVDL